MSPTPLSRRKWLLVSIRPPLSGQSTFLTGPWRALSCLPLRNMFVRSSHLETPGRSLPGSGAWLSLRPQPSSVCLPSCPRHRRSSRPADPTQDLGNERPWHGDLGELEDDVATVPHDAGADLHQLLAQCRQRPLRHVARQCERAQEVGEGEQLQPHRGCPAARFRTTASNAARTYPRGSTAPPCLGRCRTC